jgi:large subunit ribosomal protein L30
MAKSAAKTVKVKLVRSAAGVLPNQRDCLRGLGLRRINDVRELLDTPAVRGMMGRVSHLIEVGG